MNDHTLACQAVTTDLMTAAQVAELLQVHYNTVYRWVDEGHLKGFRLPGGRGLRFRRADVLALLEPEEKAG